jgi:hypothetical protein
LQAQQEFQETDLVNGKVVKFLNGLDLGVIEHNLQLGEVENN